MLDSRGSRGGSGYRELGILTKYLIYDSCGILYTPSKYVLDISSMTIYLYTWAHASRYIQLNINMAMNIRYVCINIRTFHCEKGYCS